MDIRKEPGHELPDDDGSDTEDDPVLLGTTGQADR
jgi:hypothetical protein